MVFENFGVHLDHNYSLLINGVIERNYHVHILGLFIIESLFKSRCHFSSSSFNRLDLPPYDNYHDLRNKLIQAMEMSEAYEGVD